MLLHGKAVKVLGIKLYGANSDFRFKVSSKEKGVRCYLQDILFNWVKAMGDEIRAVERVSFSGKRVIMPLD